MENNFINLINSLLNNFFLNIFLFFNLFSLNPPPSFPPPSPSIPSLIPPPSSIPPNPTPPSCASHTMRPSSPSIISPPYTLPSRPPLVPHFISFEPNLPSLSFIFRRSPPPISTRPNYPPSILPSIPPSPPPPNHPPFMPPFNPPLNPPDTPSIRRPLNPLQQIIDGNLVQDLPCNPPIQPPQLPPLVVPFTSCCYPLEDINCPMMTSLCKNGDLDNFFEENCTISAINLKEAMMQKNINEQIIDSSIRGNFFNDECKICPSLINLREMNTVQNVRMGRSANFTPQEHMYSTGIKDDFPKPSTFDNVANHCLNDTQIWDYNKITCFINFWDRLEPTNGLPATNDVNLNRLNISCQPTQSGCPSQLHTSIINLFFVMAPSGFLSNEELKSVWIDGNYTQQFLDLNRE